MGNSDACMESIIKFPVFKGLKDIYLKDKCTKKNQLEIISRARSDPVNQMLFFIDVFFLEYTKCLLDKHCLKILYNVCDYVILVRQWRHIIKSDTATSSLSIYLYKLYVKS